MIDVNKVKETMDKLEQNAQKVSVISQLISDVERVGKEIEANKASQLQLIERFKTVGEQIEGSVEQYNKCLVNLMEAFEKADNLYVEKIGEVSKELESFKKQMDESYKSFEDSVKRQLQQIAIENKQLYLDLEKVLSSKLNRAQSDIEVSVRDNSKNLKEELKKDLSEECAKIYDYAESYSNYNTRKLNIQNILIIGIIILNLVSLVVIIMK